MAGSIQVLVLRRGVTGAPRSFGRPQLMDLRDRLYAQGAVPPLPDGWGVVSALDSAGGAKFAGDFLVANLSDDQHLLELVLVDVCGKGVSAGTQSLQFAGALGGLIGSQPPLNLFHAANDYLLRQRWDDGFATAIHVLVDLRTGFYSIVNAGHPPALRWDDESTSWLVDGATGLALGIERHPVFGQSSGSLKPGEALLLYTDGLVESRNRDIDDGIAWLRGIAREVGGGGYHGEPQRIVRESDASADDDKAIVILFRQPES